MKNKREILEEIKNYGDWVEDCVIIEGGKVRIVLIKSSNNFIIRRDLEVRVKDEELNSFLNG